MRKLLENGVWRIYCGSATEILGYVFAATLIFLIIVCAIEKNHNAQLQKNGRIFLITVMAIYVFLLLYITLGNRENSQGEEFCLIPFYSYYEYMHGKTEKFRESMMNILLFYPLGLVARTVSDKKRIIFWGIFLSISIEVSQYIFHLGYAEVDDVIHNSLGVLIGAIVASMVKK